MTAGEIAEAFPLALSTISGHFRVLKYAGLVVTERQGTNIVYSLNTSAWKRRLLLCWSLRAGANRGKERTREDVCSF